MLRDVRNHRRTEERAAAAREAGPRLNRRTAIGLVGGLVSWPLAFRDAARGAEPPETLRLFSRIEPSLGDVWGQAAVVSQLAVVPSSATTQGAIEMLAVGDDHRLRLWRLSLTTPVPPVDAALLTSRIPGQSPPIAAHYPLWTCERGPDAHEDWIFAAAASADARNAVTGDGSGRILHWKIGAGGVPDATPTKLQNRGAAVLAAAFRPDSAECVVVGDDGLMRIFRVATPGGTGSAGAASVSGATLVATAAASGVRETLRGVFYSPDGRWFAECGDSGEVRVRRSGSGEVVSRWMTIAGRRLRDVAFSPDGTRLAVAGDAGIVHMANVDPQSGVLSAKVAFPRCVGRFFSIAWCGDRQLAAGSSDGQIRIYDVASQRVVVESERGGHDGTVATLVWLPDAATLASAGFDTTIRLWRIGHEV